MSEGLIVRRGGVGKSFAIISVTYPEGSTCTCSNGTKTLTAKGTSGRYVFNIPSVGTWTVTCTDGDQTASESVVISEQYQVESVELFYFYYLYKDGTEYVSFPNGMRAVSFGGSGLQNYAATKGSSSMSFGGDSTASTGFRSYSACSVLLNFDRSFSTLHFVLDLNGQSTIWAGLTNDPGNKTVEQMVGAQSIAGVGGVRTGTGELDITVDISSISGNYYVGISQYWGASSDPHTNFALKEVYMEP